MRAGFGRFKAVVRPRLMVKQLLQDFGHGKVYGAVGTPRLVVGLLVALLLRRLLEQGLAGRAGD